MVVGVAPAAAVVVAELPPVVVGIGAGRATRSRDRPSACSPWCRRTAAASARAVRSARPATAAARGGVSTFAGMPSALAPGSEVKFSGEGVLPYRPQPMPMPSSTSTAATAARIPHAAGLPAGSRRSFFRFGSCTGALRSADPSTSDCSSPSVAALVAGATRCRCSSIDSCPSASALSRTWQVSLRSLSFARVLAVCRVATTMIVRVRPAVTRRPDADHGPTHPSRRHASVVAGPTYSGLRAIAATGGGLRASAPVPAG